MIERPVHRKRSLISSDDLPGSAREVWLIPLLLIVQALFSWNHLSNAIRDSRRCGTRDLGCRRGCPALG